MPNLLKKIFRPSTSTRSPRQQTLDILSSPTRSEIDDLTKLAQTVLGNPDRESDARNPRSSKTRRIRSTSMNKSKTRTKEYLADQVEDRVQRRNATDVGTTGSARKGDEHKKARDKKAKKAVIVEPVAVGRWVGDDGQKVMTAIIESIEMVDQLQAGRLEGDVWDGLLGRCTQLLEAQRDELRDIVVHMERGRYPALRTLRQVYERVLAGLTSLDNLESTKVRSELATLVQLLEEGPDYLIDTFLIELVVHHAETLDSTLASEIREIHKKAISHPGDLKTFRRAAQGIVAYACAIPQEDLDDELGREAYRTIGILVKQLKLRVEDEQARSRASSSISSTSLSQKNSILKDSTPVSDEVETRAASGIQSRYGTGPILPSPALPATMLASSIGTPDDPMPTSRDKGKTKAPPSPSSSPASSTSSLDSISLYDYRGQILTASALDLVLRQETLALADSTGQYTGEVSWDDVRKAWIPHWVVKLKPEDLAPGEIPSTNPADFEVRDEDEFGNKIGWTDTGEMYYEEEPTFELK